LTLRRLDEIPSFSSKKFVDISSIVMASGAAEYGEEPEIGRPSNHLPRSQREAPNLTAQRCSEAQRQYSAESNEEQQRYDQGGLHIIAHAHTIA